MDTSQKTSNSGSLALKQKNISSFGESFGLCKVASSWRQILAKVRAETKKMNCRGRKQQSRVLNYDSLNYAMNFDDSCWLQHPQQTSYDLHSIIRVSATPLVRVC